MGEEEKKEKKRKYGYISKEYYGMDGATRHS
jgi:hypothetical protein